MNLDSLYRSYGLGMKILGMEHSIQEFIFNLPLDYFPNTNILDAGCGTGIIGLSLLKKYRNSRLLATDINPELLKHTQKNALRSGINLSQIRIGLADISAPNEVKDLKGKTLKLAPASFEVVATGGVIGYSKNPIKTVETLFSLVKPNGYFLNIEMNNKRIGKIVAKKYHYLTPPEKFFKGMAERHGFELEVIPVHLFPASLTRVCYLAKLPATQSD